MDKRRVTFNGLDCETDYGSDAYMKEFDISQAEVLFSDQFLYGKYTVYFGLAVIALATLKNVWYKYSDMTYTRKVQNGSIEPGYFGSFIAVLTAFSRSIGYKPINMYISKYLGLPATSGSFLFIFATTLYLALYSFVPHYWYRGCRGFGSPPLAVRTGVMAVALIPFIYILGGKSNMITLVTGISYEKLNVFHQFCGVACFVLSLIHTIPFIYQIYNEGGTSWLAHKFTTFSYYSGIPPLIFIGILIFGSNSWVRKHCYEGFLHLHWLCGIGFFGTTVWHIHDANYEMWDYMWSALAFWMSQLMYRALVKTCFKPNALFLKPRPAQLRKLDSQTFEVVVTNVADWKWYPGQHCFLRFAGSRILDNHPFSICSIPNENDVHSNELKFIIMPMKGLTRKLYEELDETISTKKKVFLDGPYGGSSRDPLSFDNLTMISTGSGVTATLPFLQYAVESIVKYKESSEYFVLRDIHFIWIIRLEETVEWIREELDRATQAAAEYVTIDIYIVNARDEAIESIGDREKHQEIVSEITEKGSETSSTNVDTVPLVSKSINIYHKKPNVSKIVEESKRYLKRKNMIVSCGSTSMRREVCKSVAGLQRMVFNSDIHKSQHTIEEIFLHTEAFGW